MQIFRDPNHTKLSFERYLAGEFKKWKSKYPPYTNCFSGIAEKIKRWYSHLLYMNVPIDKKKQQWNNVVEHLLGDHSKCMPHEQTNFVWEVGVANPEIVDKLREILGARTKDFEKVVAGFSTQKSESFHRIQLIFGCKALRFPISQSMRDNLAILYQNEGPIFLQELRRKLNLRGTTNAARTRILRCLQDKDDRAAERRTPEYRRNEAKYRAEKSKLNKASKFGDYKGIKTELGPLFN